MGPPSRRRRGERSGHDPISRLLLLGERRLRIARLRDYLRSSLWFIPALAVSTAAVLAMSTTTIDHHMMRAASLPFGFVVDAESARGLLSMISNWMMTFIGLVFTMTMVILQLASSQFSPRVISTLLRDRFSQVSLGTFIGTFAYAFIVLREVRTEGVAEFVPTVSLAVAFTLVLISLGVFIRYVNHVAQSIRAGSVITTVAEATRHQVEDLFPRSRQPSEGAEWEPYRTISARRGGSLSSFDEEGLVALARELNIVLEIVPRVGEFVPTGAPLVRLVGDTEGLSEAEVLSQLSLEQERTMQQDPAFGFRQLVDIATRALSPGVNDPTTAVQVIDQLHDILRDLLFRSFPTGVYRDSRGVVRLVVPSASWVDFLRLGAEEIRHYGAEALQVRRRLRRMLEDLKSVAPAEYQAALDQELSQLDAAVLVDVSESEIDEVPADILWGYRHP